MGWSNSKNIFCSRYPYNYPYTLSVEFSESNPNPATNTTTISATGKIKSNGASWNSNYDSFIHLWWYDDNTGKSTWIAKSDGFKALGLNAEVSVSYGFEVEHNDDGTLKGHIEAVFEPGSTSGGYSPGRESVATSDVELMKVPRSSIIGEVVGNTFGEKIIVNINRKVSSFTHQVWYRIGKSGWQYLGDGFGTFAEIDLKMEMLKFVTTSNPIMEISIRTWSGNSSVGSDAYKNVKLKIPKSAAPVLSEPTIEMINGKLGVFLKGYSKAKIDFSAESPYSGEIVSYSITGSKYSVDTNTLTTDVFSADGDIDFVLKATDKRGMTSSKVVSIHVVNYYLPSLKLEASRCNSDGSVNTAGACLKVKVDYDYASAEQKNSLTKKEVSCNGVVVSSFDDAIEFIMEANLKPTQEYLVSASVTDAVGNTTPKASVSIMSAVVPMVIGENFDCLSFGGFPTKKHSVENFWPFCANEYYNLDGTKRVLFEDEVRELVGNGGGGGESGSGRDGKSAYELAVEQGFRGTLDEWLASLHGRDFKYTDFTQEQLEGLKVKGDKGDTGAPGPNGNDGETPEIVVTSGGGLHRVEFIFKDGSKNKTFYVKDGESSSKERIVKTASDTSVTLEPNKFYVFPVMTSLKYFLASIPDMTKFSEFHFMFKSGATATQLSHPTGVNAGDLYIMPNRIYEISIVEKCLSWNSWEL